MTVLIAHCGWAVEPTWEYAVQVSATAQASPPQIALAWPQDTLGVPNSYTVYRKAPGATSWGAGVVLSGATTSYVDTSAAVGTAYEYQIVKAASTYTGYGYIYAGISVPLVENRGKVVLIVDNTYAANLAAELTRLQQDLAGDGWTVLRHDVNRTDSVASVKSLIQTDYNADPANVKSVFLFGRVPVPYSGLLNPDGHPDHYGAWPADVFYGEMDGTWTDNSVNYTQTANTDPADAARLTNIPGDGKFDQTAIPSTVELQVGRVDLSNMPGRLVWGGPPSFPSEQELLRQYLNKDHNFRHKLITVQRRGVVGDYFGVRNGEAFAASGYRNFAPFFGANNITNLNVLYNDTKGVWIPHLATNDYLWAYGCGAGSYSSIGGLGNTGQYNDGITTEVVSNDVRAVFTLLFGSWLGDWDHEDNIMRSILATKTYGLACAWSGRPHWFAHHMGLGETIGYTARLTQNNTGLYQNQINTAAGEIHVTLMGDPTLRLHPVAPAGTLAGTVNGSSVNLTWTSSPDAVVGYHVYRAPSPLGPFTRLTSSLATGTSFSDSSAPAGTNTYMVRAVKLEIVPSGSYYNASQGIFWTAGGTTTTTDTTAPVISMSAPANNATVSGSSVTVSANASDNVGVVGVQFKLDGTNLGAEVLSAPFSLVWDTTKSVNGSHTLTAVARDAAGNQATATTLSVLVSNAAAVTVVWVEDALPAGGVPDSSGGDSWNWVSSYPAPFSGTLAHQSAIAAGIHQHYFDNATATLSPGVGDKLFTYVYLDPANPPSELMLQWNSGSWEHRAYWGANNIGWGTDGSPSRYYAGVLPAAGQWTRLEVPASAVGLEGSAIKGMAFTLYDGRATWDYAGKSSQSAPPPALPTVTVVASDATATIGTSDNAAFTFTRTGDTSATLTVNYSLGGTAVKWNDYRTPAGDMPVAVTIPAGAASATMTIVAVTNSTGANPETVLLTLSPDAAYTVGTPNGATITIQPGTTTATNPPPASTNAAPPTSIVDYVNLNMPPAGSATLHILSPAMLELRLINAKLPDPSRPAMWDFVDSTGNFTAPALSEFSVTVNGQSVAVQAVGFKRRPFYAPLAVRDLRLDNCLVLQLASPVADGATVEVKNPSGLLWPATMQFLTAANPLRYSPAIHVNQEGYVPSLPKKATVGYYLGSLGEMNITSASGFQLVDAATGAVVYQGTLTNKPDVGYTYTPAPYQNVYVADFSSFTTPGEYRLVVPGLGASLAFLIDDGIAMSFARTYALGLYHQRCGTNNVLPFTRFTHDVCHFATVDVPTPQSNFAFTWNTVSNYAITINSDNPPQIAPRLTNEAAQLYPFVNTGKLDTHGGHHDAGDYSKYTLNSALFIHSLMFSVDAFPGVAALDNLGIPESGDGISDVMQEAKWEADYLARIQDADGGFYFLVYPRDREYENNVTPDHGDPQVVWPKTTSATAAAVAALAQCASSPKFKAQFPNEAALYLQKAKLGWQFLTNAVAKYGKAGAYQKITHYGDIFTHDDELAWAACEMFLATGDQTIHATLKSWFPNPNDPATYRWGWWRMWESYGCAIRSYAFAARSGRLPASALDATYLARCETEVKAAGQDALSRAQQNAYGTSFPLQTKAVRGGGWYFSSDQAFDITAAYQLDARPEYLDAILSNLNYEAGANPVNTSYITGTGWKRQREIVHQYAQNDRRVLPPDGIPLGNVQSAFSYLNLYGGELTAMCFPASDATTAPYAFYDRWGDVFNVTTEFVALEQARSLANLAYVATLTSAKTQAWTSATAQISVPAQSGINVPVTATVQVPGLDLSRARVVWEAAGQEPSYSETFTFTPTNYGSQWVEVEVRLADGRRAFAATNFFATNNLPTVSVVATVSTATLNSTNNGVFTFTRAGDTSAALTVNYQFTGTAAKWTDYRRPQGDMPESIIIPAGASSTTLTIVAVANSTGANPETVILSLLSNAAYNVGSPSSATVTILPASSTDTTPPTVSLTAPVNGATVSGSAVTVSATASDNVGVAGVQFKLDGANLGAEVLSAPYSVTWNSTSVTDGSHTLTAVARDAAGNQTTAGTVGIIVSNGAPVASPTVTVVASDATATIGTSDTGTFTFTRTGSTNAALTVNYSLGGTAVKWIDYRRVEGDMPVSVMIPAGASSYTMTIVAVTNTTGANPETVVLTLSPDPSYTVGSPSGATMNILTPVAVVPPTVTVTASDASASRVNLDPGAFTFTRTGSTTAALTVNYSLGGTATKWNDYRTPAGDMPVSVTIPAGASSYTMTILPVATTNLIGTQTVVLTLSPNPAYTVGSSNSGTISIAGNSVPISSIKATSASVTITWASMAGKTYRVAYKNTLSDTTWTVLTGDIAATSSTTSWVDKTANKSTQRYYTVFVTN
ncbi:MAG: glycoside hydrolase family 9 protein [Verrucomicrobia bacterium]|nr:glycoside hydrolase family 9 protein [Verrucomicrobiota bacterium]